jgi:two-component system cell cycle sensor histidine kinase/response regulator CckA
VLLVKKVADNAPNIDGIASQFHQVLFNLCVNALDAMDDHGTLEIGLEPVALHGLQPKSSPREQVFGDFVCLSVKDTGTGMPPEVADRIFEPFFTTKPPGKGTGLGLATVSDIVRGHNGYAGTTFFVYFPVASDAQKGETEPVTRRTPNGNGELLLLVDDEDMISQITQSVLEAFNYKVLTASNGLEAIGIFRERKEEIWAVLTDLAMPVMNGPALIAEIRKTTPDVRIVLMSGLGSQAGQTGSHRANATLTKPFTVQQILSVLDGLRKNVDKKKLENQAGAGDSVDK